MKRYGRLSDVRASIAFVIAAWSTPNELRFVVVRWWWMPVCWIAGHRWGDERGCFNSWTAYCCHRCGEELHGWTNVEQIPFRPVDEDDFGTWED